MENPVKSVAITGRCEYAGRVVPIVCTYSNSILISVECPKNGCKFSSWCKLVQDVPRSLSDTSDT